MVRSKSDILFNIIKYLVLLVFFVIAIFPLYWIVTTALKSDAEIYALPIHLIPEKLISTHFYNVIFKSHFLRYVLNSAIVTITVTGISMVVACFGAYALVRMRFYGKRILASCIVFSYLLPSSLLFISYFNIIKTLGLMDTLGAVILTYLTFTVPFSTWMMIGYFRSIPVDIDQAGYIDGASKTQVLLRLILPISLPGMTVVMLYSFTLSWNEFLYSLIFLNSNSTKTITSGLAGMVMGDILLWGDIMAASFIAILPVFIVFLCLQKNFIQGLAAGSVKE